MLPDAKTDSVKAIVNLEGAFNGAITPDEDVPMKEFPSSVQYYDTMIIGAGISGINSAYRIQSNFPNQTYTILDRRGDMGGTWDLMKYPGIRSDSDLYTFGFAWRPWTENIPIARGELIVKYMKESAAEYGIDKKINYRHHVKECRWQSRTQMWEVMAEAEQDDGQKITKHYRTKFLVLGTGYYDYDTPLEAKISGIKNFKGTVVHPQFWPENLDYANKKVAVIGSGATAITLIPNLAKIAEKVTMVQRTPSYIISFPNRVVVPTSWWEKLIPRTWFHTLTRFRFLIRGWWMRRYFSDAEKVKAWLAQATAAQLPKNIPYDPHFKPPYKPWEQRVCLAPDGDFYQCLRDGKADVATGSIKTITENTIELENGQKIEADIIVTATGLRLHYGGGAAFYVDGERINFGEKHLWRGAFVQDLPNAALVLGYAKASWTLAADVTATLVVRMMKHMTWNGYSSCTPRIPDESVLPPSEEGMQGLTSTYVKAAAAGGRLLKSSTAQPWAQRGSYAWDMYEARFGNVKKGMQFTCAPGASI